MVSSGVHIKIEAEADGQMHTTSIRVVAVNEGGQLAKQVHAPFVLPSSQRESQHHPVLKCRSSLSFAD
jgi:hypothetical protein